MKFLATICVLLASIPTEAGVYPCAECGAKKIETIEPDHSMVGINLSRQQLKSHARFGASLKSLSLPKAGFLNHLPGVHAEVAYSFDR